MLGFDALGRLALGQIKYVAAANGQGNLTGVGATGSPGTIGPRDDKGITGVSATGLAGTQVPSVAVLVVGVTGTGQTGSPFGADSKTLIGVSATGQVGSIIGSVSAFLQGVVGQGFAGTSRGADAVGIVGVQGQGQTGSVTPSVFAFVFGVAATGFAGGPTPSPAKTLTGVSGSGTAGSFYAHVQAFLQGAQGTGQSGDFTGQPSGVPSGVEGVGSAGEISVVISGGGTSKRRGHDEPRARRPVKPSPRLIEIVGPDGLPKKVPLLEHFAPPPPLEILPEDFGRIPLAPEPGMVEIAPPALPDVDAINRDILEAQDLADAMEVLMQMPDALTEQVKRLLQDYQDMRDIERVLAEID